jgi:hypothetical protein
MIDQSGFSSYLESLLSSVRCGAERYAHLDITRLDYSLQRLYGWKKMPEHKVFERYFRKFDIPACHSVFGSQWTFWDK